MYAALFTPFSYEDKRLVQRWTLAHPLISGVHDIKHTYVPKADILNACGKLICVVKQRSSIPREHLL